MTKEIKAKDKKQPMQKTYMPTQKELASCYALCANTNAAAVIEAYAQGPLGEQDFGTLTKGLANSIKRVQNNEMKESEAMLMGQAQALQSIFMNFSRRTLTQEYQKNIESFFRMAMKAQNQCRMTLETLATIKNPPVVYANQANIAHGHQQVNNGVAAPAHAEKTIQSNELLEAQDEQRLDTRTTSTASGLNSAMATVGEVNRASNR